ncbi:hypothetical protein Tco_1297361 [Tanacetum coccineum]
MPLGAGVTLIKVREIRCVMRGVGGRGRVVVDNRGGSAIVVTGTSISKDDSVLRLNIKSIPVSGLGCQMTQKNSVVELQD